MGSEAEGCAQKLIYELRKNGVRAEQDLCGRSLKAQMKYADKLGAAFSTVIGENEMCEKKAVLKNMKNGEQTEISLDAESVLAAVRKEQN